MAVEILTVSLSDESILRLADAVAQRLGNQATTESNYPSPEPQGAPSAPVSQGQPDPWSGQQAPPQQQQAPVQQQPAAGGPPTCRHGVMRFVPAGFSQSTGRAYPAFYGCQAARGAPDKCRSVPAGQ